MLIKVFNMVVENSLENLFLIKKKMVFNRNLSIVLLLKVISKI